MKLQTEWIILYEHDGTSIRISSSASNYLETAVIQFIATEQDRVLKLPTLEGTAYFTKVSQVASWMMTTKESRALVDKLNEQFRKNEEEDSREPWQGEGA